MLELSLKVAKKITSLFLPPGIGLKYNTSVFTFSDTFYTFLHIFYFLWSPLAFLSQAQKNQQKQSFPLHKSNQKSITPCHEKSDPKSHHPVASDCMNVLQR